MALSLSEVQTPRRSKKGKKPRPAPREKSRPAVRPWHPELFQAPMDLELLETTPSAPKQPLLPANLENQSLAELASQILQTWISSRLERWHPPRRA